MSLDIIELFVILVMYFVQGNRALRTAIYLYFALHIEFEFIAVNILFVPRTNIILKPIVVVIDSSDSFEF